MQDHSNIVAIGAFEPQFVPDDRRKLEYLEQMMQDFRKQHQEYKAAQEEKEKAWNQLDSAKTNYWRIISALLVFIGILTTGWVGTGIAWITSS